MTAFWPLLLLLIAVPLTLAARQSRHAACNNEKRYENQAMCVGKQFGTHVPYPDDCTKYLVCDCEYPTVFTCPATLYFDNSTGNCNWPWAVDCIYYTFTSPQPIDTTTAAAATTTRAATTQTTRSMDGAPSTSSYDPPPAPPGIDDSYCSKYADGSTHPYPYDCNAYINCTYNWPVLNYCEPDKVFNPLLCICDTPDTAHCEELPLPKPTTEATTTTESTTTEASSTTELSSTTENDQCLAPPEGIQEDYCESLGNGHYAYPYDCQAYLTCRNGCTDMAYCIPEKLFNPMLHICDTPNSVNCKPEPFPTTSVATTPGDTSSSSSSSSSTTTMPTTLATTTKVPLPADIDPDFCKDKPFVAAYPYAGDCSQYIECMHGELMLRQCASGLLFNPQLLICDEPNMVDCYTTTAAPTTTELTTTTTTVATTLSPAELCAGQDQGASFPYVDNCAKYILCFGNDVYFIVDCPFQNYFEPLTGNCGPEVSPTACKQQQIPTTTTTPATPTPTTTTAVVPTTPAEPQKPDGICGDFSKGELIAYPQVCSKYIVCVMPIPVAFYCTDGFYFSYEQQQCVSWEQSDCGKAASTTPGYTPAPHPEPNVCTNSGRDTLPYPDNCQWYISCVDEVPMILVCNYGDYYDPISQECGAQVPPDACHWDYNSTTIQTTAAPVTSPVTRPPPQEGPCDNAADGELVPYPDDCNKFIKCDRPIPAAFECTSGEEFNPWAKQCMQTALANCSIILTTTTSITTETTTTPITTIETTTPITSTTTEEPCTSTPTPTSTTTESPITTTATPTTPMSTTTTTTEEPCTSTPTPTSTTTEFTTTETPSGGICEGQADGSLVPYPYNCSKYILCEEPIAIGYDCPDGLEFSPKELECMSPDLANCNVGPTTPTITTESTTPTIATESTTESTTPTITTESTTPTTTTESTTPTTEPTIESTTPTPTTTTESTTTTTEATTLDPYTPNICCGQMLGTILPYPGDCYRFVVCDYPIPYAGDCPTGTSFDAKYQTCAADVLQYCEYI